MTNPEHRERSCSVQASSTALGPVAGNDQLRRPDAGLHLADPALREVVLVSPRASIGKVRGFTLLATAPRGPGGRNSNPPLPLVSFGEASRTPTSKFVAIKVMKIEKQTEQNL